MPLRRSRGLARTMGRTAVIAGTATAVSGHVARPRETSPDADQRAAPAPGPCASRRPRLPPAEQVDGRAAQEVLQSCATRAS